MAPLMSFPELKRIQALLPLAEKFARVEILGTVHSKGKDLPIYAFVIGSENKSHPTLGLFGGVHGLENVGTHVLTAYLESLFEQMLWDKDLRERMKNSRIVAIPIVNPGGMMVGSRSNPNGVDLMRNSPIQAIVSPLPIVGGHRISPRLPYFRGAQDSPMELESLALVKFVRDEMFESEASLALDLHSGFGAIDRLWYPYAKTTEAFPRMEETLAISDLLTRSFPNHVYKVEPQSLSYTTHGDLWDFLFDEHHANQGGKGKGTPFIPWTLEMGSWLWIRKNPAQLFNPLGVFNPIKQHRLRRTLRRHLPLLDFFLRAVKHHESWRK